MTVPIPAEPSKTVGSRYRRLVLFTNDFPFDCGDASFLQHEIRPLAEAYDDVHIYNLRVGERKTLVELPENAVYRGPLRRGTGWRTLIALLSLRNAVRLSQLWRAERRSGVLSGNVKGFLRAAIAGAHFAGNPALSDSLNQKNVESTIYAFWGMGGAFALPWLDEVDGGRFVRLHGYDLYAERSRDGYLPLRQSIFSSAKKILVVSESARTYLLQRHPRVEIEKKIVVSRLGSASPGVLKRDARKQVRTIVSCSSVVPLKRVSLILEAVALVAESIDIEWVHFGAGPLFEHLVDQAGRVDKATLSIRLRGQVANRDVMSFYDSTRVDVFVNASETEGVPVSIMEAMSFGIPVVATAVGGTPEIVSKESGSGELVDADPSATELAQAILNVLGAPDSDFRARAVWERMCDAQVNAARTVEVLRGYVD